MFGFGVKLRWNQTGDLQDVGMKRRTGGGLQVLDVAGDHCRDGGTVLSGVGLEELDLLAGQLQCEFGGSNSVGPAACHEPMDVLPGHSD